MCENIGFLTLKNPPGNEMNSLFFQEFSYIINEVEKSENIIGLIIDAEGRHFSSGANIKQLLELFNTDDDKTPELLQQNSIAFQKLSQLEIPVVACIKGICFGSALELALCAHFRIAGNNTLLSFPETGFDIIPGLGGIYNAQQCIGSAQVIELVLTGNTQSATEAKNSGLVDIIAPKKELNNLAQQLIKSCTVNYRKELKSIYLNK